jgi:hypothetical protein
VACIFTPQSAPVFTGASNNQQCIVTHMHIGEQGTLMEVKRKLPFLHKKRTYTFPIKMERWGGEGWLLLCTEAAPLKISYEEDRVYFCACLVIGPEPCTPAAPWPRYAIRRFRNGRRGPGRRRRSPVSWPFSLPHLTLYLLKSRQPEALVPVEPKRKHARTHLIGRKQLTPWRRDSSAVVLY